MADTPPLNPFLAALELFRRRHPRYDWQPLVQHLPPGAWRLQPAAPPVFTRPAGSLEQARSAMQQALDDYLAQAEPQEMLLIRCTPGAGKTTLAVQAAERLAAAGRRVAYAGPRHDLFPDLLARAHHPDWWYEWLPRQSGQPQTCRHARPMAQWLERGYAAIDFCCGVCGWAYLPTCPYHAQKQRSQPIIYIQHQHVCSGHPLRFDVLFGDENPLQAFLHPWRIPAGYVRPPGMDYAEPLTEVLHLLSFWCGQERPVFGPELLEYLGGPAWVLQAIQAYTWPDEPQMQAALDIHDPAEVVRKPYFHLSHLLPLLEREARLALAGQSYPSRIIAMGGSLLLLLRRPPNPRLLPPHVVWLDATARPEIYQALFQRPLRVVDALQGAAAPRLHGKVFQVVERANGKTSLKKPQRQAVARALIAAIVRRQGYRRPAVISFKDFLAALQLDPAVFQTGHFYAARGSNDYAAADAVIIVGAPQPGLYALIQSAKMVFFERDLAFDVTWQAQLRPYPYQAPDGQGRSYPVAGFWGDPDLQVVLESLREDEILQAAHRGRPVTHACDVWLLTNLPIAGLPPDELLTLGELLEAPERVRLFRWANVVTWLADHEQVTVADLMALGLERKTAYSYLKKIAELPGWEAAAVRNQHGRPSLAASRESCA